MDSYSLILSTAYYPPIQYFTEIIKSEKILIEQHETYPKQTYRNRCYIFSANGVLPLSIPIEKGSFHKIKLRDIKIDNSRKWQREHLHAIKSAYNSSAFFEFYAEKILQPLESKHRYLVDLNMDILEILLDILEIDIEIDKTATFIKQYGDDCHDMRYSISPKNDTVYQTREYFQVFSPTYGFKPNLSIIDLVFNMGPETWSLLRT